MNEPEKLLQKFRTDPKMSLRFFFIESRQKLRQARNNSSWGHSKTLGSKLFKSAAILDWSCWCQSLKKIITNWIKFCLRLRKKWTSNLMLIFQQASAWHRMASATFGTQFTTGKFFTRNTNSWISTIATIQQNQGQTVNSLDWKSTTAQKILCTKQRVTLTPNTRSSVKELLDQVRKVAKFFKIFNKIYFHFHLDATEEDLKWNGNAITTWLLDEFVETTTQIKDVDGTTEEENVEMTSDDIWKNCELNLLLPFWWMLE